MRISTVPILFVNAALNSAKRHGCDVFLLLQESGISESLLTQEKARVATDKFIYLSVFPKSCRMETVVLPTNR